MWGVLVYKGENVYISDCGFLREREREIYL